MSRQKLSSVLSPVRTFAFVMSGYGSTKGETGIPDFKLAAIRAMLFYENTGAFSTDVAGIDDEPYLVPSILWNTSLKEEPSTSVLVVVEATGKSAYTSGRRIEFTATYKPLNGRSRKVIAKQTVPIRMSPNGKYMAGFWLYETGCHPVRLSARIIGQRKISTIKRTIKFGCGE